MMKLSLMRMAVTQARVRHPHAYSLDMEYAYSAYVSETGVTIQFRDFPKELGSGNVYEPIEVVAHRTLAAILQNLFASHVIIPMPSSAAPADQIAKVPEPTALSILRRNWSIAQAVREAHDRFDTVNRDAIRKAAKSKGERDASTSSETTV